MSAYITWADGELRFDAVLRENHSISSSISEHPVETGSNVADNMRPDPIHVTIEGVISQTPILPTASTQQQVLQTYSDNNPPKTEPDGLPPQIINPPQPPFQLSLTSALNRLNSIVFNQSQFQLQTAARAAQDRSIAATLTDTGTQTDYIAANLSVLKGLRDEGTLLTVFGGGGLDGHMTAMYENMLLQSIDMSREGVGGKAHFTLQLREIRIVSSQIVAAPTPTIVRANVPINKGSQAPVTPPKKKTLLRSAATGGGGGGPPAIVPVTP